MTQHHFETHQPLSLLVEVAKGSVHVRAEDTTESSVEIVGRDADQVHVELSGDQLDVIAPRQRTGFLSGDSSLQVTVVVPTGSEVAVRTGSADITLAGTVGAAQLKSGSGDVRAEIVSGPAVVETGSGDITLDEARAELRIKSGSGDIRLGVTGSAVSVSTGSGDVEIGTSDGPAVVKTGSGDLRVARSHDDVALTTGSGDLQIRTATRGRLTVKGASGDVHVGIPGGVPVWTDVTTVSGEIRSTLSGAGEPGPGVDHVEVRARTVSGDIDLDEV